jgi:hypothetical protein
MPGIYDPLVPPDVHTKLVPGDVNTKLVPPGVNISNWSSEDRALLGGPLLPGNVTIQNSGNRSESDIKLVTYNAIKRGWTSPDDIAISTGREVEEVKDALTQLERNRMVVKVAPDTWTIIRGGSSSGGDERYKVV